MHQDEKFLNAEAAARFLDTTKAALYQLTCRRRIRYYRPGGGRIYFKLADLQEYIERGRVPSQNEIEQQAVDHVAK